MIEVQNLNIQAGKFTLTGIDFEVASGSYAILMGRTGSGKTTLLESICGLKPVTGGSIKLNGIDVTHDKPASRGIGYVPQDGALFPTMTVYEQLAFALRLRRWPTKAIKNRVSELSALLGIGDLQQRMPQGLSGGERQRVALGRALACHPEVLCLDEPLSALDEETATSLCALLKTVQRQTGVTTLHVTHRRAEAELLADQIFQLKDGKAHLKPL